LEVATVEVGVLLIAADQYFGAEWVVLEEVLEAAQVVVLAVEVVVVLAVLVAAVLVAVEQEGVGKLKFKF
jgi:hypothetical protein